MASSSFTQQFKELPATLPVFPLRGVILLPCSDLQLNIFEPRYLNMVNDALGAGRMIGVVQPDRGGAIRHALYKTGCAGRITIFNETQDGRFLINLAGVCRFDIAGEIKTLRGYRRILADWQRFPVDLQEPAVTTLDTAALLRGLYTYFEFNNLQVNLDALRKMPAVRLVNFLATHLPFETEQKQQLVEAITLDERAAQVLAFAKAALSRRHSRTEP